ERRWDRLAEREGGGKPARRSLGRLEQPGHPHAGQPDFGDPGAGRALRHAAGSGEGDAQPGRAAWLDVELLRVPGRLEARLRGPGGRGDLNLTGYLPQRAVVEQGDAGSWRQVDWRGEANLDPLANRSEQAALCPGGVRIAVEDV